MGAVAGMMLSATLIAAAALTGCTVTDGDTIRCGKERVRLIGIDAPDDPGNSRCRPFPKPGAVCNRRRAAESKQALQRAMTGPIRIERLGTDNYGRTLAMVYVHGRSLSCRQIETGQAAYVARWDRGRHVARECPRAVEGRKIPSRTYSDRPAEDLPVFSGTIAGDLVARLGPNRTIKQGAVQLAGGLVRCRGRQTMADVDPI